MSACKEPGCYAYAKDELCVFHKLEKSESRVSNLESAVCRLLNIVGSRDDAAINAALDFARKALANG